MIACGHGDRDHQNSRDRRYPCISYLPHANEHGRADDQGESGKKLVAHAEKRPYRGDIAGVYQVTEHESEDETGNHDTGYPLLSPIFGITRPMIS